MIPNNVDLEKLMIGVALLERRLTYDLKQLSTVDFYNARFSRVWGVIVELDEENEPLDIGVIHQRVKIEDFRLTELSQLTIGVASLTTLGKEVKILKNLTALRTLQRGFSEIGDRIEHKADIDSIVLDAENLLETVKADRNVVVGTSKPVAQVFEQDVFPRIDKYVSGELVKLPFGFDLLDRSTNGGVALGELVIFGAKPKAGKALALDTPIPTPHGWTIMEALNVGDEVFDENGHICRVVAATETMHDRECYRIWFDDGTDIVADADHQWLTRTQKARRSETQLRNRKKHVPQPDPRFSRDKSDQREFASIKTTRDIAETVYDPKDGRVNHYVPVCKPIDLPKKNLPLDPYLLGVWLGDGKTTDSRIYSADIEVVNEIERAGYEIRKTRTGKYEYRVYKINPILRQIGVLGRKHIPQQYLRSSKKQRIALLQGLMDTDGHCDTRRGNGEFTTTSATLMTHFLELTASLGLRTKMCVGNATLNGRVISRKWRVTFHSPFPMFRLSRKLAVQKRSGFKCIDFRGIRGVEPIESVPVRCIQVDSPSSLFLAGKHFIPTHNSALMLQIARQQAEQGIECYICSREMLNYENGLRLITQTSPYTANHMRPNLYRETGERIKEHARGMKLSLHFDDKAKSVKDVRKELTRLEDNGIDVMSVFVDYVQLMKGKDTNNRADMLEDIIYDLKDLALEREIAVFCNAQFNREGIDALRPKMSDFKGSSAIEMAGNLILFWTLEQEMNPDTKARHGKFWIEAGRNVAFDEFSIRFYGEKAHFELE
jgi:replicative DNA helicase